INPKGTGVFLQRALGFDVPYPRDTRLVIERPSSSEESSAAYRVQRDGDRITVTLAAGGDLAVLVRAHGVVPREVELLVQGGRGLAPRSTMSARGDGLFKHTFRRVSGPFSFRARGGDDDRGDAEVSVRVIHAPRVEMVRAKISFPTYTRKAPAIQDGGSIDALIGSEIEFHVTATAEVQQAELKFLESGQQLKLTPVRIDDDSGKVAHTGKLKVTQSDRYQVLLVGKEGLHNPNPGTYHIAATPDHPPVGRILCPEDDSLNLALPDAIVPVRVHATDDFGLTSASLAIGFGGTDQLTRPLFQASSDTAAEPVKTRAVLALVDLAQPEFKDRVAKPPKTLVVMVKLTDNREPGPSAKDIGPRQVRVVGETELLRTVSSHFRRVREDVEQNLKLLGDRNERLKDILDALEGGKPLAQQQVPITYVEVAQGRVLGAVQRIHIELMRAFDFHLFNRLEPSVHANTVLELYRTFHEAVTSAVRFHPAFYRDLEKRRRDGRLGAMDKALDPLLQMVQVADRVAEFLAPATMKLLAQSRVAPNSKSAVEALRKVDANQRTMLEALRQLEAYLRKWNEFQDVITHTRSILDQQREIQTRTKKLQGDKK
ncbi:MAG: hypothetical protein KDC87_00205, partial [Planctomycetes bacterium]|nr:hypothetical protein [Planctomycetota bacterium]